MHLVDNGHRIAIDLRMRRSQLEAHVHGLEPGCGIAGSCPGRYADGPVSSTGCSSGGSGPANNGERRTIETTTDKCLVRSRKPIARTRPEISLTVRRAPSPRRRRRCWRPGRSRPESTAPESAAEDSRLRPNVPAIPVMPRRPAHMAATAHGLCEFIDASRRRFTICATVAGRCSAPGYREAARSEIAGRTNQAGATVRAGSLVAWNARAEQAHAGPIRIVGAHRQFNLRVKQHPDRLVTGWHVVALQPYGRVAALLAGSRSWASAGGYRCVTVPGSSHRLVSGSTTRSCGVPQLASPGRGQSRTTLDHQRHINAVWGCGERVESRGVRRSSARREWRRPRADRRPDDP